jgi:hypothetical protein
LPGYVLQGNTLSKELPVSSNVEVSKMGNKGKGYNLIRFAQKDRAISKGAKIRNYCTTSLTQENLSEITIIAIADVDVRYLDFIVELLHVGNSLGIYNPLLTKEE